MSLLLSVVDHQEKKIQVSLLIPQLASISWALDSLSSPASVFPPLSTLWTAWEWWENGEPKTLMVMDGEGQSTEAAEMDLFCRGSDHKCCLWVAGETERPKLGRCCAGTEVWPQAMAFSRVFSVLWKDATAWGRHQQTFAVHQGQECPSGKESFQSWRS